jgi:DHA1 family tetracycline resistance protein-like MFS transporter
MVFHALAGACAGTNTVVNAYIADVTEPKLRARAYGLVGSAFGLGFVAGPTIGGLLGAVDVRLPFYAAAGLAFANVAYGYLILPESRCGDRTTALSVRVANPIGSFTKIVRRPVLGRLTLARFAADIARMTNQVIWTFFVTYQFRWSTAHVGITMAAGALAGVAFQAMAVGPGVRWLGDKRAAVLGSMLGVVALIGTALASAPWAIYTLQAIGVLSSLGSAAAQAWISRATGADEQGTVQGALTGTSAVAEMVVPVTAGAMFAWSLTCSFPGLVYLGAAAFAATSTLLLATTAETESPTCRSSRRRSRFRRIGAGVGRRS